MYTALAIGFLLVALVGAYLGFRSQRTAQWEGGKLVFVVFAVLALVTFLGGQ
jgi:uncharacterized membrane protein YtjA (UPF0391 family)